MMVTRDLQVSGIVTTVPLRRTYAKMVPRLRVDSNPRSIMRNSYTLFKVHAYPSGVGKFSSSSQRGRTYPSATWLRICAVVE